VEKIVIISSQPDKGLIALLIMVFTDCEIHVSCSRIEALIAAEALGDKIQSSLDIKPPDGG